MKRWLTIAFLLLPSLAAAQSVAIRDFGGIVTHATFTNEPIERARKSVNWLFGGNGELIRNTLDWRNVRPGLGVPVDWMAPAPSASHFFYGLGGSVRYYNIDADTSTRAGTAKVDNVNITTGDSTVLRTDSTGSLWLKLTLAEPRIVKVVDSSYSIYGFYDKTTLVLKRGAYQTAAPDSLFLNRAVGTVNGPPGNFVANDTLFIADGDRLHYFLKDSVVAVTYPTYAAYGKLDSLVKVWSGSCTNNRCDTVYAWANFPDSILAAAAIGKFYFLFQVDTFPRGIPVKADAAFNIAGATERIRLVLDSAYCRDGDTAGTGGAERIKNGATYLAFRPAPEHVANQYDYLYVDTGNWDYVNALGNVAYGLWTPNNAGQYFSTVRDYDCRMMRPQILGGVSTTGYSSQCRVVNSGGVLKLLVWDKVGSLSTTDKNNVALQMYENPLLSMGGAGSIAWNWRIAELHKFRAWYAGNQDTLNRIAWTGDNNFDSIAGSQTFDGSDPVVALSSQDALYAYCKHKIMAVRGTTEDDFFFEKLPAGVGAVNDQTVVRDPYSNADYFPNALGMWSNASGSVTEIKTDCQEIFTDSINWAQSKNFWGAIHNRFYYLGCAFGSSSTNNRIVIIDLDGSAVTFLSVPNPGCLYVSQPGSAAERLFVGDADSTRIVEIGGADELYSLADWRSSWSDLGDRSEEKRIESYVVSYDATSGDSLFVDLYYSGGAGVMAESNVVSDTIVATATGLNQKRLQGQRKALGHVLAVGFRTPDQVKVIDFDGSLLRMGKVRAQ